MGVSKTKDSVTGPLHLALDITNKCNYRCLHCYQSWQPYHAGRLLWGFRRLSAVPDREQGADQHATDGAAFER